jgi:hypothetical protein
MLNLDFFVHIISNNTSQNVGEIIARGINNYLAPFIHT